MRRFTQLFLELDSTNKTSAKVHALASYLQNAPAKDAAWAVAILTGRRIRRAMSYTELRSLAATTSGLPEWLVEESHSIVGDLSETIALILPPPSDAVSGLLSLSHVFEDVIRPLRTLDAGGRAKAIEHIWSRLDSTERFVFHKLLSGHFRVGVQKRTVIHALSAAFGIDQAVLAHRLSGHFEPTAEAFSSLVSLEGETESVNAAKPYPFYLASPIEALLGSDASSLNEVPIDLIHTQLGPATDWIAEWKWDGIRAQLIRRDALGDSGRPPVVLWSRGEEEIDGSFPELLAAAGSLPSGTVLDGELIAWENGAPLPFQQLQRRLQRKQKHALLFQDVPVLFMAYDSLEVCGVDIRLRSLMERRQLLDALLRELDDPLLVPSPIIKGDSWATLAAARAESRQRAVEGLMLKKADSAYEVGRVRGNWWKWKIEPYTVDAIMVGAQLGHGRRASLYTDYTFAVWTDDPQSNPDAELVPIAKAYSGLTNTEIIRIDKFIRDHTLAKHGPTRTVQPRLVFEIAFEGIQESSRHKSGIALRFPRIARIRDDKLPREAETLTNLRRLLTGHDSQAGARP